ncbi:MAG: D-glycero-alpha-D-manno-heptose-1,7-bisphosphate 7-phosphatase [Aminipila sp.]
MKKKAFFLDRDGTIIIDKGYLDDPKDIEFIEGIPELLIQIKSKGYLLVIISNQSGVARGYFDEENVQMINSTLKEKLINEYDLAIDGIYYCPHHPDKGHGKYRQECDCRKPKPGMVLQAIKDLDIDVSQSVMVGDKDSDEIRLEGLDFIKILKDTNWSYDKKILDYLLEPADKGVRNV